MLVYMPFQKGHPSYRKNYIGRPQTKETRQKISISMKAVRRILPPWNKGAKVSQMSNEKHPGWKGDNVSYASLHRWISEHYGRSLICENCNGIFGSKQIHWANVSGFYFRERWDWKRLCVKCHWAFNKTSRGSIIVDRFGYNFRKVGGL